MWAMLGVVGVQIRGIVFNKMESKIGFKISLIVVEAIRGRFASFMILTVSVSEIFCGQTNSSILVVLIRCNCKPCRHRSVHLSTFLSPPFA